MEHGILEVTASHSPFAFLYSLFRVTIEIDGVVEKRPWGTHAFEVAPGPHSVAVSYPWLFMRRCGRSAVEVQVGAGETARVHYTAGPIRYLPGTMTVESVLPTARVVR